MRLFCGAERRQRARLHLSAPQRSGRQQGDTGAKLSGGQAARGDRARATRDPESWTRRRARWTTRARRRCRQPIDKLTSQSTFQRTRVLGAEAGSICDRAQRNASVRQPPKGVKTR